MDKGKKAVRGQATKCFALFLSVACIILAAISLATPILIWASAWLSQNNTEQTK